MQNKRNLTLPLALTFKEAVYLKELLAGEKTQSFKDLEASVDGVIKSFISGVKL